MNKIILFDIDYTLFDTTKFKEVIKDYLSGLFPNINNNTVEEIYYQVRAKGRFEPALFSELFFKQYPNTLEKEILEALWYREDFVMRSIYSEVPSVLSNLQKIEGLTLGLFSSGRTDFQLAKVSSLSDYFHEKHIHIADFKEERLEEIFNDYRNENIILVDDLIKILESAKKVHPKLFSIWMKRGKYGGKESLPENFTPDATITNLTEILDIVDKK